MSLIEEARAVRQRIAARLQELEPLVREYDELRRAAAELGFDPADPSAGAEEDGPAPAAPTPPPASRERTGGRRRSGSSRSRGSGASRSRGAAQPAPAGPGDESEELIAQVLEAVHDQPGQTVGDYARALNLAPTLLYRPVRELTTAGQIVKRNRQLYPS